MSAHVEVRPPEPDEVEAVTDMWVALAADQRDHGSHLFAAANRAAIGEALARQLVVGGLRVAAGDDGDLLGFVSFALDAGRYESDAVRGVVRNIYVHPGARNRGVGGRLLDAAEEALAAEGAEVIRLEAMAANDAARRFYERRGYAPHRVEFEKRVESDTRGG
ncbi:MAG: GNAT family N-acetyltransferase [Haloferacaceae archaeon]